MFNNSIDFVFVLVMIGITYDIYFKKDIQKWFRQRQRKKRKNW